VRNSDRPFYPQSLERGMRRDRALRMAVAEIYIKGVSTRKVQDVFSEMCNAGIPAGQVSRAMRELDAELERWRNRPIGELRSFFSMRHTTRPAWTALSSAWRLVSGIMADGRRSILAVDANLSENEVYWRKVLSGLKERGMHGVNLVVSDSHDGLGKAR